MLDLSNPDHVKTTIACYLYMSQRHDALTLLNYHSLLPVHEPAA